MSPLRSASEIMLAGREEITLEEQNLTDITTTTPPRCLVDYDSTEIIEDSTQT